ncbi:MAG: YceI family protein [Flavobacteriales bacterium]|nr:YceI family protein [Flavobacteriales bacterium]
MKKQLAILSGIMAFMVLVAFKPTSVSDGFYTIDTEQSVVNWVGSKITGKTHTGTVKLVEGGLMVAGGKVDHGKFTIDMTSINVTDLDGDMKQKLEGHLKNDDFFAVDKHKTARLVIVDVRGDELTAELTIKGITNKVTFPAKVVFSDNGTMTATAKIEVDRSKFDVRYGSGSFFDDLGDKAIDDIIKFEVKLVGKAS